MKAHVLFQYTTKTDPYTVMYGYFNEEGLYQESPHGLALAVRTRIGTKDE